MRKITIDGIEINTNLGGHYPIGNGNATATMDVRIKKSVIENGYSHSESDEQFVRRLAHAGYKTISLKYATTRVRGYYDVYALVK